MKERIIFHIDVNNAFLSWTAVEKLKNGERKDIRNTYAIIAGDEKQRKGIVLAKSIPCKQKGVITGEPIYSARRKCPYLEIYKPEFEIYKKYSNAMYNYLCQYTNIIERYSIDECFLDYTESQKLFGDPLKLAYKIKNDIKRLFGFTVNIGIGNNKLCAKMASDFQKPDRVHTLFSNEISKMWPLDVGDLFMIGKRSSTKLRELDIKTIGDLAQADPNFLIRHFKSMGKIMHDYANGIDDSPVEYEYESPKSVSTSTVLPYNYSNKDEIIKMLKTLSSETGKRLRHNNLYASVISIWIKYNNFTKVSKQIKLDNNTNTDEDIYKYALILFDKLWNEEDSIRGLCVGVSDVSPTHNVQLSIFSTEKKVVTNDKLQKTLDNIKNK